MRQTPIESPESKLGIYGGYVSLTRTAPRGAEVGDGCARIYHIVKHVLNRLELAWFFFGNNEYPVVTKAVKAAQMKDLVQVVARICEQKLREGRKLEEEGPYKDLPEERLFMMRNLARFYSICKEEGMFSSKSAAEELQEVV